MEQMQFNVLRKAHDNTKVHNSLTLFFNKHGIDIAQVKRDPEYYEELIMEYSRECINKELFEQSKEKMEEEFSRLCEFHRRNEEQLVEKFYSIVKDMIEKEDKEDKIR